MYTTQVGELARDLTALIRRHEGRDITRTEIVRQFATEGCVLLEKDEDLGARHMRDLCAQAVSVAACLPQTVDVTDDVNDSKAERRMWGWLRDILGAAMDSFWDDAGHRRLAREFLGQAEVILTEDEFTSDRDRAALKLVREAQEKLLATNEVGKAA